MSLTENGPPRQKRSLGPAWLPWLILVAGVLAVIVIRVFPSDDWEPAQRNFSTGITALLTLFLLLAWGLICSAHRLGVLGGALLAAGLAFAAVKNVELTGDMVPVPVFRWQRTDWEELQAHRKAQADGPPLPPLEVSPGRPADFPEYRGRNRDGVVTGPPLARDWKAHPPRLQWRQPVGGGYAGFAVAGNAAVTIEQRGNQEAVVCYDTGTGRERWTRSCPALFTETMGGPGPRATPTIAGDTVFSLGATGKFVCLELPTGKVRWEADILKDNDNLHWGMSGSPLVYDTVVIVNPGAQTGKAKGRALVAYDRASGREVWTSGTTQAGYSSPMLATLAGRRQILVFDGEELGGYDADGGAKLWRFPWGETLNGINVCQPVVLEGDRVFISAGYGIGCAMVRVTKADGQWKAEQLWRNKALKCKFSSPVVYEGFLYGLDEGVLTCVDAKSGERRWKDRRYGHGQLLRTHDLLLILGEEGQLALVPATPHRFTELGRIDALAGKTWNYLALADGKAYVRNHREMACYDLTEPAGP